MKKEGMLISLLIGMAVAGVIFYHYSQSKKPSLQGADTRIPVVPDGSKITWQGFEDGMANARTLGKPVFLYFHAEWCSYCIKLKKTTFKDKKVLSYLFENFVSISVDSDKYPKLTKQWKVIGLPTLWFLKPDGTKIANIPGYVTHDQLENILKYVHTKKYETITFNDYMKTL